MELILLGYTNCFITTHFGTQVWPEGSPAQCLPKLAACSGVKHEYCAAGLHNEPRGSPECWEGNGSAAEAGVFWRWKDSSSPLRDCVSTGTARLSVQRAASSNGWRGLPCWLEKQARRTAPMSLPCCYCMLDNCGKK